MSCFDCGLKYGSDGWIEAIIPDAAWEIISPNKDYPRGGTLCITCIARRLKKHELDKVPVFLCGMEPIRTIGNYEDIMLFIVRNWKPEVKPDEAG